MYYNKTATAPNMIIDKTDDLAAASIISNSHINTPSSGTPSFYNEPTGTVSIGGNAIQGQVLTATNNLQDVDGMGVISYNWNADGIKIPGAINNSFLLTSDQVGKTITVIANYIDGHKSAESVSSPATNSVANSPGTNHNDNLIGTTSNDTLFGFSGNDTLKGLGGNDVLDGGAGNDTMIGGDGNDTYYVDSKKDQVIEAAKIASGTDIIISTVTIANLAANVENLTLVGTNTLNATGNSLVNQIKGNAGNNNLNGGLGNDILTGGDGNDLFIFNTKIGANNVETITDFTIGVDKIALDDAIFKRLKGDKDLSDNFINGLFSLDKNDYLIYNPADGKVSYDSDGSGLKSAPVTIALIGLGINVTADDFIIV
jgi:Ca2+-binding RTX toxin-like protein